MSWTVELGVAIAIFASAFIQGLSGLGFSLIAAPVITQVIPGAGAIGLVNLLALSQNSVMLWREEGRISRPVVRQLLPGLACGVVIGLGLTASLSQTWRPLVVTASSLGSLAALLLWHPTMSRNNAAVSATWSGAVNTYASVGGPPLAAYLVRLDLPYSDYVRTQQFCFALLNIVSVPLLGIPSISVIEVAAGIAIVYLGTVAGRWTRRFVAPDRSRAITVVVIFLVATAALGRSIVTLVA